MVVRVAGWPQPFRGLRAMDPARDLGQVADLIERTFSAEPDGAGRNAVAELRRLDRQRPLLWILSRTSPEFGEALPGYVWLESNRIVGNASITREDVLGLRWLLNSVGVDTGYRRRGIARELVNAAADYAQNHGGHWVELLVQVENVGALGLYEQAGFVALETVSTLRAEKVPAIPAAPSVTDPRPVTGRDLDRLLELARESTPQVVQRVRPIRPERFAGEWRRGLLEILSGWRHPRVERWGIAEGGRLVASVRVGRERKGPSTLELMVAPDARGKYEAALVEQALFQIADRTGHPVVANVSGRDPAAMSELLRLGFVEIRTLSRMVKELPPRSSRGEGGRFGGT